VPVALAIVVLLGIASPAWAGIGPEGVLLVVNPQSPASLAVANHYARLREIPPDNVLFLPWNPKSPTTDIETFRRQILLPVLQAIQNRRLADQIDCVAYSCDFPWAIALEADIQKLTGASASDKEKTAADSTWPKHFTPVGSLNGMTYLWQAVMAIPPAYFDMRSNLFARPAGILQRETAGFRGNRQYGATGGAISAGGRRYLLSMMLGVTAGRGNSLEEILDYLKRSASADATGPKGTIYFVRNNDIRSKARHDAFAEVVGALETLGVTGVILEGTLPLEKSDVQGVVMGAAAFDWEKSGSVILPGALCDNFPSFGGVMHKSAGQTPISEFLRRGAAGASGTVPEPYAIADKFPSPWVQLHYARGCTLAEAFYQSIGCPYQLLIVGDPLCRPWAKPPKVSLAGVEAGRRVQGVLELQPSCEDSAERFELFVDGLRVAQCGPNESFSLATSKLADGYHEIRVVGIGPEPIETQGRCIVPVWFNNYGRRIEASVAAKSPLRSGEPIALEVRSPDSKAIVAIHGSRVVGRVEGSQGQILILPNTLGVGPVALRVVGLGRSGATSHVMAEPLDLSIEQ